MARRVTETLAEFPWLVALHGTDEVAGYAYAHRFATRAAYGWSVETSVYVHENQRGTGVGRALYGALIRILHRQGYRLAIAGMTLPNAASAALHRSAGFTSVGVYRNVGWKFDRWHDVEWFQLDLRPGAGAPMRPIPLPELDDIDALLPRR
jgi:phosphinothricin acetyltransferase